MKKNVKQTREARLTNREESEAGRKNRPPYVRAHKSARIAVTSEEEEDNG